MGYPNKRVSMTDVHGEPQQGGYLPAEIWHDYMAAVTESQKCVEFPPATEPLSYQPFFSKFQTTAPLQQSGENTEEKPRKKQNKNGEEKKPQRSNRPAQGGGPTGEPGNTGAGAPPRETATPTPAPEPREPTTPAPAATPGPAVSPTGGAEPHQ
jgi:membrane peptidoglycan carboxypeptidase